MKDAVGLVVFFSSLFLKISVFILESTFIFVDVPLYVVAANGPRIACHSSTWMSMATWPHPPPQSPSAAFVSRTNVVHGAVWVSG